MPDIKVVPDKLEPSKKKKLKSLKEWLWKRKPKKVIPKYEPGLKPGDSGARWKDSLYLGVRRTGNVLLHVGMNAAWIAGMSVLKGVPIGQALTGAGLVALSISVPATMGIEKTVKERRKSQGKSWNQLFDLIVVVLKFVFKTLNKKEKSNG